MERTKKKPLKRTSTLGRDHKLITNMEFEHITLKGKFQLTDHIKNGGFG